MNFVTKFAASVALGASILLAPAAALAYYPYTYFTGPSYFGGGGGFSVGADYYGSSNCSSVYGCGSIGYNAMNGQWTNGGLMGGYSSYGGYGGYGGMQMGYGQIGGSYAGGGIGNYMQYVPANARQYVQMGYGNYGGYGGGYGGYVY